MTVIHLHNRRGKRTSEYRSWANMKCRCTNPKASYYADYGGRGIAICERWNVFANFLADMGLKPSSRHTLERLNVNGNYEPGNCVWALPIQQNRNQRKTLFVEFMGQSRCLKELSEAFGVVYETLRYRVRSGWPIELALRTDNLHSMTKGH